MNTTTNLRTVTIFYHCTQTGKLHQSVNEFSQKGDGRVILPEDFKHGKSIIAVCDGQVKVLNKIGDRVSP